jgi:hypothetical protein
VITPSREPAERISGALFRGDDQIKFGPWVSELFEKTGLETAALMAALEAATSGRGLKPLPAAMAYGGPDQQGVRFRLDPVMERLSRALRDDPLLVSGLVTTRPCAWCSSTPGGRTPTRRPVWPR